MLSSNSTPELWEKVYYEIDLILSKLVVPTDAPQSIDQALIDTNDTIVKLSRYYSKVSRTIAESKIELGKAKLAFKLSVEACLNDKEFRPELSATQRRKYAEVGCLDEAERIAQQDDFLTRLEALEKVLSQSLSTAKMTREDIVRRVRLLEITKGLSSRI